MHHKIVSIKSSGLKSEKQFSLEIADGPIWLGQIVLRNESKMRPTILVYHFLDISGTRMTQISHNWILLWTCLERTPFFLFNLRTLNMSLSICACIHLFLSAAHLDLKKQDIKLVPPLTLEILDGPVWLGQLVLRNELTVRSTILVDPFLLAFFCTSMT